MLRKAWLWSLALALMVVFAHGGETPKPDRFIHGATDKEVAIYQPGEKMIFTLKVFEDGKPIAGKKVKWQRTGDDGEKSQGEAIATEDGVKIVTQIAKPGFVRIQADVFGEDGKKLERFRPFDGGACVAPEKLTSGGEEPADFDEFWKRVKADVAAVPMQAEVKEVEWKHKNVKLYAVKIDCAGPRPVTGYLTIPVTAKEKSLKAALQFSGYGVRSERPWLNPSWMLFHVNAHGMELEQPKEYYDNLTRELGGYAFKKDENRDPKTAYFYGMACRLLRAFEYIKTRPEWNGKDLASNGGSQGGLQALWGAALVPGVTSAEIRVSPWCCDLAGVKVGRLRGWRPDWTKALDYYDPVFMGKRIKNAWVYLVANYGDYACPPSGVWVVYNNLLTPKKSMEVKQGCTHGYQMKNCQSYLVTPEGIKDVKIKE